jgi:hypothetical protein
MEQMGVNWTRAEVAKALGVLEDLVKTVVHYGTRPG